MDFASLYPSIMIAHNLCYSTLILSSPKDYPELEEGRDYLVTPTNNCFVKTHIRKGFLPEILRHLLSSREKAKNHLKMAKDTRERECFNARQLALKINSNSVYGFTGAQSGGMLPCIELSQSVTSIGRTMIALTKEKIEEKFNGLKVIYGDTDSVMINMGFEDMSITVDNDTSLDISEKKILNDAFALGKEIAKFITGTCFISPVRLEFEKIYFPYLLINKKRYAGLYYTNPDKYDKMDCKGIETIRRDNCPLVARVINTCLEKILINRNPQKAIVFVKETISNLLRDKIDISQLVITKELQRKEDDYKGKQAHAELVKKLKKRAFSKKFAVNIPKIGDRVPYVIVCGSKGSRIYEKAEDPIFALENKIPIDYEYYLENQIGKPLIRIFEPILGSQTESLLLRGDHTLVRKQSNNIISKTGPLCKFLKIRDSCVGCNKPLVTSSSSSSSSSSFSPTTSTATAMRQSKFLCKKCNIHQLDICKKEYERMEESVREFEEIKMTCIDCQGSEFSYEDILCSNSDCPIFYKRKKIELDVMEKQAIIDKLSL